MAETHSTIYKCVLTAVISFGCFGDGITVSSFGSTLLDFAEITRTSVDLVNYGLIAQSFFYMIGALTFGWLYSKFNRQILVALAHLAMAAVLIGLPNVHTLVAFILCQVAVGIFNAAIESALNVWLVEIWQNRSNPFLLFAYFWYGIGSTSASYLCGPFLSVIIDNGTIHRHPTPVPDETESRIYIPYDIIGGLLVTIGLVLIVTHLVKRYEPDPHIDMDINSGGQEFGDLSGRMKLLTLLGAFIYSTAGTVVVTTLRFFNTFLVASSLHIDKTLANNMYTVLNASSAVGIVMAILLALKFKAIVLLYVFSFTCLAGYCLMELAVQLNGTVSAIVQADLTWVSAVLIGLGTTAPLATSFSFVAERVPVTNVSGGLIFAMNSLLAVSSSFVIGQYVESLPIIFVYCNFTFVASFIALVTAFSYMTSGHGS